MDELSGRGAEREQGSRKGPWTTEEDKLLTEYVSFNGEGRWSSVARSSGLNRSGKSCRLRWVNYLRPGLKKCQITPQEEGIIIELHALWGNKWSTIARYLPGRTDNEIKNYWRTHFKKRAKPSQNHEKRKAQLLQHKKQLHEQQQDQNDTDKVSPNAEVSNEIKAETQGKQDVVFMCLPTEDQYYCLPVNHQDFGSLSDITTVEDDLWGGLWNLDNPRERSDLAIQNQASANNCSCGGKTINWFDHGGYNIF